MKKRTISLLISITVLMILILNGMFSTTVNAEEADGTAANDSSQTTSDTVSSENISSENDSQRIDGLIQNVDEIAHSLANIREMFQKYNSFDITEGYFSKSSSTKAGITYTWDGDVCTVSGTSTGYSVNILKYYAPIPKEVIPGETLYVHYHTTDQNVMLRIMWRDAANKDISAEYLYQDGMIRVPKNAAIWTIGLYITPNKVIDGAEVSGVAVLNSPSNKDIINHFMTGKEMLANGTDLNDVRNEGHYLLVGSANYSNNPLRSGYAGTLIVFSTNANIVCQMLISLEPDAKIYVRTSLGGTFSAAWKKIGDTSGITQELANYMTGKGVLATNTDLDTVKNEGHYLLIGGSPNYVYTNSPVSSSVAGTLIVFRSHANVICQMVVSLESDAKLYVRTSQGGTFPKRWKEIGGKTAGVSAFLESTGDNTDRTGDIQAMLDTTGVCRLGPGRFVVTGIEIPNYCTLEGCGNSTALVLADSVSTGYAVKLNTYSTVKNMRIVGATSAITISSTVGTRHGILFEGTKQSGSGGGTTCYRSRIHQCQIMYFSGGGITCTGTGVSMQSHLLISDCEIFGCNAGINIPYYSEFHRVSNCSVENCYYGCIDNGGNNNFSNCDFSGNRVGLLIDNSKNQSVNNSHGTFSGCSINHSYSDRGVINQGTAIRLLKSNLGEIFTGMQIFYGAIEIENCMGVRFIGANIGRKVPITVKDSKVVTFSNCTFKDPQDSADSPFTQSGNTTVEFTNCYLHDGSDYQQQAARADDTIIDTKMGGTVTSGVLNSLIFVADWQLYTYIDSNNGKVKKYADTTDSSSFTSCTNLIAIPSGTKVLIHGASSVATYDANGDFISCNTAPAIDMTISSADAAYFKVQYNSVDLSALRFYFTYRFEPINAQNSVYDKMQTVKTGIEQTPLSVDSVRGNPIVITDCDVQKPFEKFTVTNVSQGENVVICKKNIFKIRHKTKPDSPKNQDYFERNGVKFYFDDVNNTVRIASDGAKTATISGFSDFGSDFRTVNGTAFYHNFKFKFATDTRVTVTDNPVEEVTFDCPVQMRVYDGTNVYSVGPGGVTFTAEANKEYIVYFLVRPDASNPWKGDITFRPQIEIGDHATAYEVYCGERIKLSSSGSENLFTCGGTAPGIFTALNGKVKALFDSESKSIYVDADDDTDEMILVSDTSKDGTVNGNAWDYICKFTPGETPVCVRVFPDDFDTSLLVQVSDGANVWEDSSGKGLFFEAEAEKEYAFRIKIREHHSITGVLRPVIATGVYAIQQYGTREDPTVIYTDGNASFTATPKRMSTTWGTQYNREVINKINELTGGRIMTPFSRIKARGAMVSFIDDDTTNLTFVKRYHDIFAAKGQVGGYAVETGNLDRAAEGDTNPLVDELLKYEAEGFAMLYHCHEQHGDETRYWIKGHVDSKHPERSYDPAKINENFMTGLRKINEYGFSNYKYWVTPYGVNDKYIVDLAKNHGMQCILNCPGGHWQEGFVTPYGNVSRWDIPRFLFGNYSNNDNQIHRIIQNAKATDGWVIIVSHVNSWGGTEENNFNGMKTRLENLIQYCIDNDVEIVSFPVGFEEYRASFMLNELF